MREAKKRVATVMLLLSCAVAQNTGGGTARVEDVTVAREGSDVRIEVTVSSPARTSVSTLTHPERLVLELPNSTYNGKPKSVDVQFNGVRRVRMTQHSEKPPIVRVVVELDAPHEYTLSQPGSMVVLEIPACPKIQPPSRGAPAAGTSGRMAGIFHRQKSGLPPNNGETLDTPVASAVPPTATPTPTMSSNTPILASAGTPPVPAAASVPQSQPTTISPRGSAGRPAFPTEQVAQASPNTPNAENGTSTPDGTKAEAKQPVLSFRTPEPGLRTVFKVKYVAEGVAYLDGGRSSGLAEGTKLEIEETDLPDRQGVTGDSSDPRVVAELEVTAVAETSAVTEVHSPKRPVKPGDLAYLSSSDAEMLVQQRALSTTRKYPAVVTFTEGDTLDEEAREEIPRPPLPSINRARGRFGFDYMGTVTHGTSTITSSDIGTIFRGDITRIGGTYWNLSGYWRGRVSAQSPAGQQTLQDLIDRTYHLSMTYDNPNSAFVAGFGRLYLPWAPSLNTIDGGYFGGKLSKGITLGIFGGSTPDPTSWDYTPDRAIAGAFINCDGGSFDDVHYSSTSGLGVSMLKWQIDRPFIFFENTVSYKRYLSIYDSLQADSPRGNPAVPAPGPGLSVNFLTVRVQPHPRVELDFNYNYFRDIPTFDPALIGTGLLDKYLFQGFSAGGRLEVWKQIFVYGSVGRSNRTGDSKTSLNQMYGITFGQLPWLGLRADAHYARFSSSFGDGFYRAGSVSKNFRDNFRLEILAGDQNFASSFTTANHSRFIMGNVETNFGPHYFIQGSYTVDRGQLSYDQWMFTVGYRFDSKERHRE